MADIKISALPSATILNNTDVFPIVQGGITKKSTLSNLSTLLGLSSYLKLDGSNSPMTGQLILNADPTNALGAATKQFVENSISSIDLSPYFKKDGSVAATGSFNMNGHDINGIATLTGGTGGYINFGSLQLTLGAVGANTQIDGLNVDINSNGNILFTNSNGIGISTNVGGHYAYIKSDSIGADVTLQVGNEGTIAVTQDITNAINALLNGAGPAYDTLKELQDLILSDESSISSLLTAVNLRELLSNKATDFTTINNTLYPTVKAVDDRVKVSVPSFPTSDGYEYLLTETDGVSSWGRTIDANGATYSAKSLLQAGATGDWSNGHYIGATSGVITGTYGGQEFYGQDATNNNYYLYKCLTDNDWYRVQTS